VTGTIERLLAEIDLSRDRADHEGKAAERFARAIATLEEIGAENELGLALAGYGRLAKNRGDNDRATDRLTRAVEILSRLETHDEPDRIRQDLRDVERTP
jgi:tetratricopeptide (TPR) repeat protein